MYETSVLRTFKNCSYTTHHTPLIIHHSSYTTHQCAAHYTPLINTPLIIHHSSYTTYHTPLIIHHSSYTTYHTPLIIHHSSYTTYHTPLIIHHSSYTTREQTEQVFWFFRILCRSSSVPWTSPPTQFRNPSNNIKRLICGSLCVHGPGFCRRTTFCNDVSVVATSPAQDHLWTPGGAHFGRPSDVVWRGGQVKLEIRPVQEVSHQGRYNKNDSHQVSQLGQRVLDSSPAPQSPVPVQAANG